MKVVTLIDIIRPIFNHYIHFLTQNLKSGYLIFEFKIKLITLGNFFPTGGGGQLSGSNSQPAFG